MDFGRLKAAEQCLCLDEVQSIPHHSVLQEGWEGRADPGPGLDLSHGITANEPPLMRKELKPCKRSSGPLGMLELTQLLTSATFPPWQGQRILPGVPGLAGVSRGIFKETLRLHVLHFGHLMLKQKGTGKGGKKTIGKDFLIRVLLWSVVLVKARAVGSAGNRLLLPSPSLRGSVSADRKTWGEEFGEAPKRSAGGTWAGLTLGISPGAAAGPSLLPHTRDTPGVTSRKTRDMEVTTQVSPSHLPSKSFSRLLTNIWDVLRESIT